MREQQRVVIIPSGARIIQAGNIPLGFVLQSLVVGDLLCSKYIGSREAIAAASKELIS